MAVILVEHDTNAPALYGAAAAAIAAIRQVSLMHLSVRFDMVQYADAVQHAVVSGGLVASGLCWFERLTGKPVGGVSTIEEIVVAGRLGDIVVPVHPGCLEDAGIIPALKRSAAESGLAVETIVIVSDGGVLSDQQSGLPVAWRDAFGRIDLQVPAVKVGVALPIGLIGARSDHLDVYPAGIASLADAADQLEINLDLRFINPLSLGGPQDCDSFQSLAGILLPGGAAMKNVRGQIEAASVTLASGIPTVGLCLGMQTMATAIAWRAFGRGTANLTEADPDAAIKTFVAMAGKPGMNGSPLPEHRTGEQTTAIVPGTRLSGILPALSRVRYNHRFQLDRSLLPALQQAGLKVAAEGLQGSVVDAIEDGDHPFFVGMQGHPELGSRQASPHPLLSAFLVAAQTYQRQMLGQEI